MHTLLFGPLAPVIWLIEFAVLVFLLKRQKFSTLGAVLFGLITELGAIVFFVQWVLYAGEGKTVFGDTPKGATP